ncbi:MAG: 5-formyltetrahydrofolate cyclo-ligase [Alistipes sp.]|nr:5-formyltetrahydrofolate cyclo-ligase [Alistipes sp.]
MTQKKDIRSEVRRRIKLLSGSEMAAAAESIFSKIEQLDIFGKADCIALFAAMNDEVPTAVALDRWPQLGKRVVVPRVEGDIMRFYDYSPEQMRTGAFGILEPEGDNECRPEEIDLIIVPARAFTRAGERLGRGGGFYDKYMSKAEFRASKVGIAFECQIFDSLPCDLHDIRVDHVVTE